MEKTPPASLVPEQSHNQLTFTCQEDFMRFLIDNCAEPSAREGLEASAIEAKVLPEASKAAAAASSRFTSK